jgi:predicted PurR-regulated permease PerM
MNIIQSITKASILKRIVAIVSIVALIYMLKSVLNLLLLTFIFTFIFYQIHKFIYEKANNWITVSNKLVTVSGYLIMLVVIIIISIRYIPQVTKQLIDIVNLISTFNIEQLNGKIDDRIFNIIKEIKILDYVKQSEDKIIEIAKHIGTFSMDVVIAFILSFFFLLEKEEIMAFGKRLESSKISAVYSYYKYFGGIFLNSFGKVIELQIVIAFVNSVLSVIALVIMGFPQALGLGAMIFILGLVPVAGVIVSLIPLSIIAFKIGGIVKVIAVLIMIAVLHALESYVLNPKLMSMKTKLPVFLTFIILLVGEHLMGVWGLLLGIPLFMFFLEIFDIRVRE